MRSPFFAELRKENGNEYKPDSQKVMQSALDGYLKSKTLPQVYCQGYWVCFVQKGLGRKGDNSLQNGMGRRPNKAQSLTKEEEIL